MRKSVLTGLLVCAFVFTSAPNKVSAQEDGILPLNENESPALMLAVAVDEVKEIVGKTENLKQKQETIVHKVQEGETLEEIAKEYDTTWKRIYDKNEEIKNPDVINVDVELIIPEEKENIESRDLPVVEKPVARNTITDTVKAPATELKTVKTARGSTGGNRYSAGYCTWYVKNRRPDLPNNLGNASTWFQRASAQGIAVGYTPRVGAAAQKNNHVVYVEAVNSDGTIVISEMNYRALYTKTTRTVAASEWRYIYK